jgi:uncharacterized PurR-regulated membrane protein YhhQ (DUF165 family)
MRVQPLGAACAVAYLATIPLANWMIDNVGTEAFPGGPHTIPVGPWQAPSGVLAIGAALAFRDVVQSVIGKRAVLICIAIGVLLSYGISAPALATASAVAFLFGELADLGVYSPLRDRHLFWAVFLSGVVGGIIDSLLFLQIAFGSTQFWQGQVVAKALVSLLAGCVIFMGRRALPHRLHPAAA